MCKMNLTLDFELSKEDNLLKRFEEIHNYIYANEAYLLSKRLRKSSKYCSSKFMTKTKEVIDFRFQQRN